MCGIRLEVWQNPNCQICKVVFGGGKLQQQKEEVDGRRDDVATAQAAPTLPSTAGSSPEDGDDIGDTKYPLSLSLSMSSTRYRTSSISLQNLQRRGPDSFRTIDIKKEYNYVNINSDGTEKIMDKKKKHASDNDDKDDDDVKLLCCEENNICFHQSVKLHSSVLKMRQDLKHQPVRIARTATTIRTTGNANDGSDHSNFSYLCWNGEVYERRRLLSEDGNDDDEDDDDNNDNHDALIENREVWQYDVSDTNLVANLLTSRFDDDHHNDCGENDGEDVRSSSLLSIQQQQSAVADVMSSLYNAEFAFLMLTQNGVFFGRDEWGRRSLLRWTCPEPNCSSFIITSVAEYTDNTASSPNNDSAAPAATATTTGSQQHVTQKTTTAVGRTSQAEAEGTATDGNRPLLDLEWTEIPPGQVHYVDLSFKGGVSGDSGSAMTSQPFPQLERSSLLPSVPQDSLRVEIPKTLLVGISDQLWSASLELEFYLRRAVAMRMDHSTFCTGVLFSGGVDSAVLAALAADIMVSSSKNQQQHRLHLYNVSFGPDRLKSADRQAALESYNAIRKHFAIDSNENVNVNFHDIAVDWQEVCDVEQHVRTLLRPKSTVMDVNIATALWFASSGAASLTIDNKDRNGDIQSSSLEGCNLTPASPPRVLLLGMGADEQMGGYGRHRKSFMQGGWDLLCQELKMDQDRLWERNLGRDDRLVCDHSKEARFPFLDAHVVEFLKRLQEDNPHLICNMELEPGQGDKQILRLVAKRLGLYHASGLVKRAIQFGSRISHLSDKKRFGSRRKAKGDTKI